MDIIATIAALFTAALAVVFAGWMLVQLFKSN